ncbi:MAG: hypothetical protein ISS01_01610 [Nanoarchaeota archaeon]|nr:hypothetical protein [Nanoarchaeota archaeon]
MRLTNMLGPLILSGCIGHQNVEVSPDYDSSYTKSSFQADIQRELSKHDPVSLSVLERDYTQRNSNDNATRFRFLNDSSESSFVAAFNPTRNELILPFYTNDLEENEEVIGALDHELWHSIYFNVFERGSLDGYDGPSLEEAKEYCSVNVNSDRFQGVRDEVEFNTQFRGAMVRYNHNVEKLDDIESLFRNMENTLPKIDFERFRGYVDDDVIDRIMEDCEEYDSKYISINLDDLLEDSSFVDKIFEEREYIRSQKGISENLEGQEKKDFLEDLLGHFEIFNDYFEEDSLREQYDAAVELESDLYNLGFDYRVAEFESKINGIDRETAELVVGSSEITELLEEKSTLEANLKSLLLRRDIFGTPQKRSFDDVMGFLDYITIKAKSNDTIYNCDEFLAREFDEIYSLDFQEMNEQGWPLTRESLDFWSRFTVNGEPMFGKGIEKYGLALDLIEKGKDPEKVKEKLEFAEDFKYQRNSFNWASEDFQVQGDIPSFENMDDMVQDMIDNMIENSEDSM